MEVEFLNTLALTLKLAVLSTFILLIVGLPIAYYLAYSKSIITPIIESIVSLPMVLPPTVIGFYLLVIFSPTSSLGAFLEQYFNLRFAFSFEGILLASVIVGMPFMIQPLQNGFLSLPESYRHISYSMGKSKWETFYRVLLPNIKKSLVIAIALSFAHCIGEFGVVLMVGGNIPNETRIVSIAIYDELQSLNYDKANSYSFILLLLSFLLLIIIYSVNRGFSMNFIRNKE